MPEAVPKAPRRATPPDPEYAWMAIIVGALVALGGAALTILSLHDSDGRAVLWIALGTVGLVGIVFGLRGLVRIRTTRR